MDREDLLNDQIEAAPVDGATQEAAVPQGGAQVEQDRENGLNNEADPIGGDADASKAEALLDSLMEDGGAKKPEEPAADAESGKPTADQPAAEKPKTDEPKTLDEQEAEALEGVKSERGRERIKAVFAERKALEGEKQQLQSDITEFKELVKSTGMRPEEFAQTLEFGRLINSGDEINLRVALQMLDSQREVICKRLGIEAPGVDALSDFPDLKQAVDGAAITREHALQLAKYRRDEQAQQQARATEHQSQQEMQQFQQSISQAAQTAQAYFDTRKHEADYPAKMARIHDYFRDQARMQEFVQTYQPNQWFAQFKFMYDNMSMPQQRRAPADQPIRSRTTHTGNPQAGANVDPLQRDLQILDSLGL